MDTQKCCNPFRIKNHQQQTNSVVSPLSLEFLEEHYEFIPRKISSNLFMCESCVLKIKNSAANYTYCCNPLNKHPHKTRKFSVITEKVQQQYFLYTNKLPVNEQLCTSCRLQITRNVKQFQETQKKCVNPFRLQAHSIGRKSYNVSSEIRTTNPNYAHLLVAGRKICGDCLSNLERKRKSVHDDNDIGSRKKQHIDFIDELSTDSSTFPESNVESHGNENEQGCVNPFQIAWHNIGSESTSVTSEMRINYPSDRHGVFKIASKICSDCRTGLEKKRKRVPEEFDNLPQKRQCVELVYNSNMQLNLYSQGYNEIRRKEFQYDTESECSVESNSDDNECTSSEDKDGSDFEMSDYANLRAVDELNSSFAPLNISPLINANNLDKKYHRFKDEVKKRLDMYSGKQNIDTPKTCNKCEYILDAAKAKFREASTEQKYTILTTVSKGISKNKLKNIFKCSQKIVKKSVELREREGPFSHPALTSNAKTSISSCLKQKVIDFYRNPNNSRTLPGTRENIQIKTYDGKKDLVAKKRLLLTLRDLYKEFLQTHSETDEKISISTFYLLKPRECVWMGNSMYQKVCCCVIHENFNQLLACLKNNINLNWILSNVPCDAQNEDCMFGVCSKCPKNLDMVLSEITNASDVTFYQWVQTDRIDMNQITETTREFKTRLRSSLPELLKHHFLVRKQNRFLENWRLNAQNNPNEVLVKIDFAMNYSFVFQNEVQSAHWHRKQATIHPFYMEYYCHDEQKLKNKTYVGISDHLKHDTVCFYSFQTYFIEMLRRDLPHVNKIIYMSDGSSAQYKNRKNIVNLLNHKIDFGIDASWEYFPTAHGKSKFSLSLILS